MPPNSSQWLSNLGELCPLPRTLRTAAIFVKSARVMGLSFGPSDASGSGWPIGGARYVAERGSPLSSTGKAGKTSKTTAAIGQVTNLVGRLKQYPLGAIAGLVGAAAANLTAPELVPDGWMEAPFTLACVAAGMLLERTLHYAVGWYLDPTIQHLAASREAKKSMAKLHYYKSIGYLTETQAAGIAANIARRDIAGRTRAAVVPRGPRTPYKRRPKAPAVPAVPAPPEAPERKPSYWDPPASE